MRTDGEKAQKSPPNGALLLCHVVVANQDQSGYKRINRRPNQRVDTEQMSSFDLNSIEKQRASGATALRGLSVLGLGLLLISP